MANASLYISRFHNLSGAALADEIGRVDSISKAAEAELKALKDEFRARGLKTATGDGFTVTACETISGRLDAKRSATFSAPPFARFEVAQITNVIRIKPTARTLAVAA